MLKCSAYYTIKLIETTVSYKVNLYKRPQIQLGLRCFKIIKTSVQIYTEHPVKHHSLSGLKV